MHYVSCDGKGFIEQVHVTAANAHESKPLKSAIENFTAGTYVLADKGYTSIDKRAYLEEQGYQDGIMHKALDAKA